LGAEEAFFFHKHCITMREQTEWVELIENGFNVLTGADKSKILDAFGIMKSKKSDFNINLYGNGEACNNIVKELESSL